MTDLSRRDFLKLATSAILSASGLLGLAGFFKFLDYQSEPARKTAFDLGLAVDYPPGSRSLLSEIPALLIHGEGGYRALSLVCTHLGCTVEQEPDGFTCPCHASRYDTAGKILKGPAKESLRALRVERTTDERLILHLD
jgi:cytochrome b6-f complex iron-sulfur subunit